jgi:hypothetical protein
MKGRTSFLLAVPGAFLAMSLVGCQASKSANPTSPSVAGPIPGVNITAPKPLAPSEGSAIKSTEQPITLVVENASTNGQRVVSYIFEVASDSQFASRLVTRDGVQPGTDGKTSLRLPDALAADRTYYWRAKADDGANASGYSAAVSFAVVSPVEIGTPVPLFPISGATTASVTPDFGAANAPKKGPYGSVTYAFDISENEAFSARVALVTVAEGPSQTTFRLAQTLKNATKYFWRVRAADPSVTGAWSVTQSFVTPAAAPAPSPSPSPSPSPGNSGKHVPAGPLTEDQASKVVYATAAEFPSLMRVFSTDAEAEGAAEQLLLRTIWHLQLAGFRSGRQQNPSGAISKDKLTIYINGAWHSYDIFRLGYAGVPTEVQFMEVVPPNYVASSGIAD